MFKIAAESQLICLKPSLQGAAVSARLRVCVKRARGERYHQRDRHSTLYDGLFNGGKKIICDAPLEPALDRQRCLSIKTQDTERRVLAVIGQINAQ